MTAVGSEAAGQMIENQPAENDPKPPLAVISSTDAILRRGASECGILSTITKLQGGPMNLPEAPLPIDGFLITHFLTVRDQAKSRDFYAGILGGKVLTAENPCIIKLSNSWIILNNGGGPTPDKPEVTLEPPADSTRVNSFLNLRVADIQALYTEWKAKGAEFITEPLDNHGLETRCYMRDPDGYIIELGQASQKMVDLFSRYAG